MIMRQAAIGNCTSEEVIEELFGSVSNFANLVEEHGDNFVLDGIKVEYDESADIHWFYYLES